MKTNLTGVKWRSFAKITLKTKKVKELNVFKGFEHFETKKVKKLNLVDDMEQIAENWNNIGLNLRSLSKRPSKKVFNELIDLCQEVFNKEYLYHSKILDSFGDNKKGA